MHEYRCPDDVHMDTHTDTETHKQTDTNTQTPLIVSEGDYVRW